MSENNLPADFLTRMRQILTPFIATTDEREALITEAFFLYDPIVTRVNLEGSSRVFCTRFISQIKDHCLTSDQHAVARLGVSSGYV